MVVSVKRGSTVLIFRITRLWSNLMRDLRKSIQLTYLINVSALACFNVLCRRLIRVFDLFKLRLSLSYWFIANPNFNKIRALQESSAQFSSVFIHV